MTVQRTLHVLFPEVTAKWEFRLDDDTDLDRKILQYFIWSLPWPNCQGLSPRDIKRMERASVVVAFQPPWILSPQDIKEFARCRSVSPIRSDSNHTQWAAKWQFPAYRALGNAFAIDELRSEERAWAKVHLLARMCQDFAEKSSYGIPVSSGTLRGLFWHHTINGYLACSPKVRSWNTM